MTNKTTRNLKIQCSWNGSGFSGFQSQPGGGTVEDVINQAWNILTKEDSKITGCSRLDAGVHANKFVFNVHTNSELDVESVVKSLNGIIHHHFKADICIYSCEDADENFHARFSSKGKHYQYKIWHGYGEHCIHTKAAWHVKTKENWDNLQEILNEFVGTFDFNGFRASDCGAKNTVKTIHKIVVTKNDVFPELITVDIYGSGFLKNMIRNIMGMGFLVVSQKRTKEDIQSYLKSAKNDYNLCAPPWALTLMEVYY